MATITHSLPIITRSRAAAAQKAEEKPPAGSMLEPAAIAAAALVGARLLNLVVHSLG